MGGPIDEVPNVERDDSVTMLSSQAAQIVEVDDEALTVLVVSPSFVATYALPASSEVTIGRSSEVEIFVDDPLVSRRHAVLSLGSTPTIRDLGSSNGTRVDGVRLAPAAARTLAVGDVVVVGSAVLMLQRGAGDVADPGRHPASLAANVVPHPADGRKAAELLPAAPPARSTAPAVTRGAVIADLAMRELYALAERIASGDISVLILGETGVGKEVMAEEIHRRSSRCDKPFVRLNCGAFTENLLETELFGHERGAFTSAVAMKPGLLETAHGGTVLLDEIGEMPMSVQVKLLRVLEEKQLRRVGGVKARPLEVRFLASTNRDLKRRADEGVFRKDLYYRLAGATLEIPPLRRRLADIEPLARVFLQRTSAHLAQPPVLSPEALAELRGYPWPGNIRELKHVIERAVLLAGADTVRSSHLSLARAEGRPEVAAVRSTPDPDDADRARVLEVLAACGGNQSRAAKQLGMSRGALIRRLERYGVVRPRKSE